MHYTLAVSMQAKNRKEFRSNIRPCRIRNMEIKIYIFPPQFRAWAYFLPENKNPFLCNVNNKL